MKLVETWYKLCQTTSIKVHLVQARFIVSMPPDSEVIDYYYADPDDYESQFEPELPPENWVEQDDNDE